MLISENVESLSLSLYLALLVHMYTKMYKKCNYAYRGALLDIQKERFIYIRNIKKVVYKTFIMLVKKNVVGKLNSFLTLTECEWKV